MTIQFYETSINRKFMNIKYILKNNFKQFQKKKSNQTFLRKKINSTKLLIKYSKNSNGHNLKNVIDKNITFNSSKISVLQFSFWIFFCLREESKLMKEREKKNFFLTKVLRV